MTLGPLFEPARSTPHDARPRRTERNAVILALLLSCPWSWCLPRESRTNEPVHSFDFASVAWEPATTSEVLNTDWTCGWHSPEAVRWARRRDRELHASHEDAEGLLCEANRLWTTTLFVGAHPAGEGVAALRGGNGMYAARTCRPLRDADLLAWRCDEVKVRGTSRCVARPGLAPGPSGVLVGCLSDDPEGCR